MKQEINQEQVRRERRKTDRGKKRMLGKGKENEIVFQRRGWGKIGCFGGFEYRLYKASLGGKEKRGLPWRRARKKKRG